VSRQTRRLRIERRRSRGRNNGLVEAELGVDYALSRPLNSAIRVCTPLFETRRGQAAHRRSRDVRRLQASRETASEAAERTTASVTHNWWR
jgi:hypothetical protein